MGVSRACLVLPAVAFGLASFAGYAQTDPSKTGVGPRGTAVAPSTTPGQPAAPKKDARGTTENAAAGSNSSTGTKSGTPTAAPPKTGQ